MAASGTGILHTQVSSTIPNWCTFCLPLSVLTEPAILTVQTSTYATCLIWRKYLGRNVPHVVLLIRTFGELPFESCVIHVQPCLPFRIETRHQRIQKELRPAIRKIANKSNNIYRTCTKSIHTFNKRLAYLPTCDQQPTVPEKETVPRIPLQKLTCDG